VGRALQFHARDDEIAVIEALRTVWPTVIAEISVMSPKYMAGITKGLG